MRIHDVLSGVKPSAGIGSTSDIIRHGPSTIGSLPPRGDRHISYNELRCLARKSGPAFSVDTHHTWRMIPSLAHMPGRRLASYR